MPIEMSSDGATCYRCGKHYQKRKGNFQASYAVCYKGVGFLPICKSCIDTMYKSYLSQCNNAKDAVRQMCRKLDLCWNETTFENLERKNTAQSLMSAYIQRTTTSPLAGKSYDDTLADEGTLWGFSAIGGSNWGASTKTDELGAYMDELTAAPITKEVVAFWGTGYSPSMYAELEQRRAYYMSKLPDDVDLDIGMEAIIRQICSLELDINRDRAAGKAVDKSVNALNTLLGSANWKPTQKKESSDSAYTNPLGVWLYRYENERPLPKPTEDIKDVNAFKKNVFTWMGHLCKMLSKKNGYTRLYEEEITRLRVEKPEYEDEDDETLLSDAYSEGAGEE